MNTEDLEELMCETCGLYLSVPPITLNDDDEVVCGRCPNNGPRISIYEEVAKTIKYPCRYKVNGCVEKFYFGDDILRHEKLCTKRNIFCPFETCEIEFLEDKAEEHFTKHHAENIRKTASIDMTQVLQIVMVNSITYLINLILSSDQNMEMNVFYFGTVLLEQHKICKVEVTPLKSARTTMEKLEISRFDGSKIVCQSDQLTRLFKKVVIKLHFEVTPDTKLISNLLRNLQCPKCGNYFQTPIKQCEKGHSFCGKCSMVENLCNLCGEEIREDMVNFVLQDICNIIKFPCSNIQKGCNFKGNLEKLANHVCNIIKCPICENIYGHNGHIINHFKEYHEYEILPRKFHQNLQLTDTTIKNHLFYAFETFLIVQQQIFEGDLYFKVFFISQRMCKDEYTFQISLCGDTNTFSFSRECFQLSYPSGILVDSVKIHWDLFKILMSENSFLEVTMTKNEKHSGDC